MAEPTAEQTTECTTECRVQPPWFQLMANGSKTMEGRLNRGQWRHLQPGQRLCIRSGSGEAGPAVVASVVACQRGYASFAEAYRAHGQKLLPGVEDEAAATAVYAGFYSDREVAEHGVVVVEL
jgi:ASC-1-like (ASCH) protein